MVCFASRDRFATVFLLQNPTDCSVLRNFGSFFRGESPLRTLNNKSHNSMKRAKTFFLSALLAASLLSCNERTTVTIVSTNDIHAAISNFSRLATLVDSLRAEGEVILVDAGDQFTGNPYVDEISDPGMPMRELTNKLDFDLSALGNHAFDYGQEQLGRLNKRTNYPLLCANMEEEGSPIGDIKAYHVEERNGVSFCFLALLDLVEERNLPDCNPELVDGLTFKNYKEVLPAYKDLDEKYDVVVAMSHLGYENDLELAALMPELDLIIGGHSHTVLEKAKVVSGVPITQTGKSLRYAGVTTFQIDGDEVVGMDYKLVPMDEHLAKDKEVEAMIQTYLNIPEFDEVLAQAPETIYGKEAIGTIICDALKEKTETQFALYNKYGVRTDSIVAGDIKKKDIYKIEPFENTVYTASITIGRLKKLILDAYKEIDELNILMSGGRYDIVLNKKQALVLLYDDKGKELRNNKAKCTVTLSNFIVSTNQLEDVSKPTNMLVKDILSDYFKTQKKVAKKANTSRIVK